MTWVSKYKSYVNSGLVSLMLLYCCILSGQIDTSFISGIVNNYTKVDGLNGAVLTVQDPSFFSECDRVLIIQVKGAEINLENSPEFGKVTDMKNAGNHELNDIAAINENEITLAHPLVWDYDAQSALQLVRVPVYDVAIVDAPLECEAWNGATGGVLIIECLFDLILESDLNVSAKGLRPFHTFQSATCNADTDFFYPPSSRRGAPKGEGVAVIDTPYSTGRGAAANGGGGGNNHNGGGGGGGNFGSGGQGGNEWEGCDGDQVGGIGGHVLHFQTPLKKIYMGGGGGDGHSNNQVSTSGGSGGGIAIIKAKDIVSNGFSIFAQGESVTDIADNDGAGGGGGGGSIIIDARSISNGLLNVILNGGDGGDVNSGNCHGPGGGGGGGFLRVKTQIESQVDFNLEGGQPGLVIHPDASCQNESYGAQNGERGGWLYNSTVLAYNNPFSYPIREPDTIIICEDGVLLLEGIALPDASYFWTGPSDFLSELQNPVIENVTPDQAGTYCLRTKQENCPGFNTLYEVIVDQEIQFDLGNDTIICSGQSIQFDLSYLQAELEWQDGSNTDTYTINEDGVYSVIVQQECGTTIDDIQVETRDDCILDCPLYAPNAFTPNFDNINDLFKTISPCQVVKFDLQIFNRWGTSIFQSSNIDEGWNGLMNNQTPQPNGVYVWIVKAIFLNDIGQEQTITQKGFITLIV